MGKIAAPVLLRLSGGNLSAVFALLGLSLGGLGAASGALLRNPPGTPVVSAAATEPLCGAGAGRFALLWAVFFCNIVAGIQMIGFQSPLLQDLLRAGDPDRAATDLARAGATLIAASSLFNGFGRMLWGSLSDRIGRACSFRLMLGSQVLAFLLLTRVRSPWLFGALVCYILLCYGGGFGTMPSFVLDLFGPRRMARVYGALLTAWSAGGIAGPQMLARLRDAGGPEAAPRAFLSAAGLLAAGFALSWLLRDRPDPGR
jgi:OFA family oxalate/formate antiporter-like MFS transporter